MATELEIKLTAAPSDVEKALTWLVAVDRDTGTDGDETLHLGNTYYDTPSGDLNGRKAALRIRRMGDRFIQTLKTRGQFVDGAHQRQEWEWPLQQNHLDLSLLTETTVKNIADPSRLQPIFETNFERRLVMIEQGADRIEAAFDIGEIVAGDRVRPLHEIEFELKAGDASALLFWAQRLAQEVPVFLNLVSKAEQGYQLAGIASPEPAVTAVPNVYGFLRLLSDCWLRQLPFPAKDVDLTLVRQAATAAGVAGDFEILADQLSSGFPVSELIAGGLMGRVQLSLAKVAGQEFVQ